MIVSEVHCYQENWHVWQARPLLFSHVTNFSIIPLDTQCFCLTDQKLWSVRHPFCNLSIQDYIGDIEPDKHKTFEHDKHNRSEFQRKQLTAKYIILVRKLYLQRISHTKDSWTALVAIGRFSIELPPAQLILFWEQLTSEIPKSHKKHINININFKYIW